MKRSTTAKTAAADPDTSFYDLLFPRGQPTSAGEWSTEWAERETRARPGQTGRGRRGQRAVGTRIPDAAGGLLKAALPAAPRSPTVGAAMPGVRSGYLFFIYPPPLSLSRDQIHLLQCHPGHHTRLCPSSHLTVFTRRILLYNHII